MDLLTEPPSPSPSPSPRPAKFDLSPDSSTTSLPKAIIISYSELNLTEKQNGRNNDLTTDRQTDRQRAGHTR